MGDKKPKPSDDSQSRTSPSPRNILRAAPRLLTRSPLLQTRSPSSQLVASRRFNEASSISFLDNLVIGELIGQGTYGKVYIALHSPDNKEYAVKKVQLDLLEPNQYELVQTEVANMHKVKHHGLLRLENAVTRTSFVVMVMPLMAYSSCDQIIRRVYPTGLPETAIGSIVKDVINAVVYLHGKNIIHRTIKASHILIRVSGEAVLSGFRHMLIMPRLKTRMTAHNVMSEMSTYINWISPEMMMQDSQGFGLNSDLYSIGITICELGNGVVPYSDVSPSGILVKKLEEPAPKLWDKHFLPSQEPSGTTPAYFEEDAPAGVLKSSMDHPYQKKSFSTNIKKFVTLCTVPTPETRITIEQATKFKFYMTYAKDSPAATLRHLDDIGPPLHYKPTIEAASQPPAEQSTSDAEDWDLT